MNVNSIAQMYAESDFLNYRQIYFISWFGRVTMLVNSAVNPLIYSVVNPSYRKAFQRTYCRCCPDGRQKSRQNDYELVSRSTNHSRLGNSSTTLSDLQWT